MAVNADIIQHNIGCMQTGRNFSPSKPHNNYMTTHDGDYLPYLHEGHFNVQLEVNRGDTEI